MKRKIIKALILIKVIALIWFFCQPSYPVQAEQSDFQTRQQQQVERLYWDWYVNGGWRVEAQRREAQKQEVLRFEREERIRKATEALKANVRLNELTFILYHAVVEKERILDSQVVSEESLRQLKNLEQSIETIGKEMEALGKKIRGLTK